MVARTTAAIAIACGFLCLPLDVSAGPESQPAQQRVCGQSIAAPAQLPPAGSDPVVFLVGVCFSAQGDVSAVDPETYLFYIQHTVFSVATSFNNQATDSDVDIDFPVKITATTLTIKQASGGIITPPTGGDTEKSEHVVVAVSNNEYSGVNNPISMTFEVWYDLPSLRREAVIHLLFNFTDRDGTTFQKQVDARVAP